MLRRLFGFIIFLIMLTSCAQFSNERNFLSDLIHDDSAFFTPKEDFPVVVGDTGKYWNNENDKKSKNPSDLSTFILQRELQGLENSQSDQSLDFYYRHKAKLVTTSEKIYFLRMPPYERRDYLIGRGFISETQRPVYHHVDRKIASVKPDILMGMKKEEVTASWGKPIQIEVAGSPNNEIERWYYDMNGASKYIYFEGGVVQGWD